jgi:hypothetical protein
VELEARGARREARHAFRGRDLVRGAPDVGALERLERGDDVGVVQDQGLEARVRRGDFERSQLLALAAVGDDGRLRVGRQFDLGNRLQLLEGALEARRLDLDAAPVVLEDDVGRNLLRLLKGYARTLGGASGSAGAAAAPSTLRRGRNRTPRDRGRDRQADQNFHPLLQ